MALQRYRALAAMVALGEFTVKDLSTRSGVAESSVRTIIDRLSRKHGADWVERIGHVPSKKRGGSYQLYRLTDEGEKQLLSELRRVEETVEIRDQTGRIQHVPEREISDFLLSAEQILLEQLPNEADEREWRDLLELARLSVKNAGIEPAESGEVAGHFLVSRLMLDLAESEKYIRSLRTSFENRLKSLRRTLADNGLDALSRALIIRFAKSEVFSGPKRGNGSPGILDIAESATDEVSRDWKALEGILAAASRNLVGASDRTSKFKGAKRVLTIDIDTRPREGLRQFDKVAATNVLSRGFAATR